MSKAIYPGSFDPITNGHIDIIERSAKIFDKVIVGVLVNYTKDPLFSPSERVEMIKGVVGHLPNVEVLEFGGLLVDFAHEQNCNILVRGLRVITDFEYELQLAQTNKIISPDIETVFLSSSLKYSYLSSSIVKEIAIYNGDISHFVRDDIREMVIKRLEEKGLRRNNE